MLRGKSDGYHCSISSKLTLEALDVAVERARRYVETIADRSVAPSAAAIADLSKFHEPFPEDGADPSTILATLDKLGSPATMASTGRRYFGFVIGGSLPAAMAASWLAGAWDQNAAMRAMSPVAAELEEVVIAWICDALHLPASCAADSSLQRRWRTSRRSPLRATRCLRKRGGT